MLSRHKVPIKCLLC